SSAIMAVPSASPPGRKASSCAIFPGPMLTQFLCTGARVRQLDRLIAAILGELPATAFQSRRSSKGFDNNVQPFPAPGMLLGPFPRARTDAATKFSVVHQPLYRAAHPGNVTHIY